MAIQRPVVYINTTGNTSRNWLNRLSFDKLLNLLHKKAYRVEQYTSTEDWVSARKPWESETCCFVHKQTPGSNRIYEYEYYNTDEDEHYSCGLCSADAGISSQKDQKITIFYLYRKDIDLHRGTAQF